VSGEIDGGLRWWWEKVELAFGAERKKDAKRGWKPTNSAGSTEALGRPFGGASASSLGQHLAAKVGVGF